jgi:hypothetical protein
VNLVFLRTVYPLRFVLDEIARLLAASEVVGEVDLKCEHPHHLILTNPGGRVPWVHLNYLERPMGWSIETIWSPPDDAYQFEHYAFSDQDQPAEGPFMRGARHTLRQAAQHAAGLLLERARRF